MKKHILDHNIRADWAFMAEHRLNFHVVALKSGGFSGRKTVNGDSVRQGGPRKPLDPRHLNGAAYAVRVYPHQVPRT